MQCNVGCLVLKCCCFCYIYIILQVTNAGTFRFNKEDHTVANLLRMQLLRDPSVRFAGYFHPHPLVHYINLKIQTNNSTVAPVEVLSSAIEDLANETDHLITQFQEARFSLLEEMPVSGELIKCSRLNCTSIMGQA